MSDSSATARVHPSQSSGSFFHSSSYLQFRSRNAEAIATAKDLTAGTIGACAGIVVGQPLDTIRVRMQIVPGLSVAECALRTLRVEGFRAFYKGMLSPLLANAPINAIVFGARGNMNRMLDQYFPRSQADIDSGRPSYGRGTIAALWGASAQCIVCVPSELIKCKLQAQSTPINPTMAGASAVAAVTGSVATASSSSSPSALPSAAPASSTASASPVYKGTFDCARQIYRAEGIRGLYGGWWVTCWRDIPGYAAWFVAYDYSKTLLQSDAQLKAHAPVSTSVTLVAGGIAGVATWVSTYPFDVIKSVIQTAPPTTPKSELKIWHVMKTNYKQHGLPFFFRGITPTIARAIPVSAVTFYVYEICMDFMGR